MHVHHNCVRMTHMRAGCPQASGQDSQRRAGTMTCPRQHPFLTCWCDLARVKETSDSILVMLIEGYGQCIE